MFSRKKQRLHGHTQSSAHRVSVNSVLIIILLLTYLSFYTCQSFFQVCAFNPVATSLYMLSLLLSCYIIPFHSSEATIFGISSTETVLSNSIYGL